MSVLLTLLLASVALADEPEDVPVASAPAPVTARIQGRVREAGLRTPLGAVDVVAEGPDGRIVETVSAVDGTYTLDGLEPGTWTVTASGAALRLITDTVVLRAGETVEVDPYLVRDARLDALVVGDEIVVLSAERTAPEVVQRTLSVEEIEFLPGTNNDVVKAVQNLPGVARAPLGIGQLIIRGTAPEDSSTFLDGSRIPLVFHFAGLTSILPTDAIREVAYLPSNFTVRYGRVLGGVVDLRTDDRLPERSSGHLSIDVYQSALFVEQRIGENTALTVSGRRSYVDAVLTPLLSGGGLQIRAPRYYDGQLRLVHKDRSGGTWDALLLATDDRFRFLGAEDEAPAASLVDQFQRLRLRYTGTSGDWLHETTLSAGPERRFFEFAATEVEAEERRAGVDLRDEWTLPAEPGRVGWRVGADVRAGVEGIVFDEPRFGPREEATALYLAPAAYVESTALLGPLLLQPGLRADALFYDDGYQVVTVDPRLTARLDVGPTTTVKAGVGKFSALPGLRQVAADADGNPNLTAPWALQTMLGVDQELGPLLDLSVTAFYSQLDNLIVGREQRLRFFTGPPPVGPFDTDPYANDGVGLVCGVEALARLDLPAAVGLVSATLSHSQRRDRPDEPTELFAYDQPLLINALYSQQLPKNWRIGGRFRYGSGNPYTPVVNRFQDMGSRNFVPVYGERSSARIPPFYSLDLRIDKTYTFDKWRLVTYLDIQNATFAQNVEVVSWTYDYSEQDVITSNPPLPVFGFEGAW